MKKEIIRVDYGRILTGDMARLKTEPIFGTPLNNGIKDIEISVVDFGETMTILKALKFLKSERLKFGNIFELLAIIDYLKQWKNLDIFYRVVAAGSSFEKNGDNYYPVLSVSVNNVWIDNCLEKITRRGIGFERGEWGMIWDYHNFLATSF